jgi:ketosteroid isomerase-like protein
MGRPSGITTPRIAALRAGWCQPARGRVAIMALFLGAGCAGAPPGAVDPSRSLLLQREAQLFQAVAARDADRVAAHFADHARLHVANMPPVEGREAIRRFYENMFRFLAASVASPETAHVSASGDLAYTTGGTSNRFRAADGTVEYAGKYVLVWIRYEGDWQVALYAISSNEPTER